MGTSYIHSKNFNKRNIIKLLALKDGRLSAVFIDSIEIYSSNNFELELLIEEGGKYLKNFMQLNNGYLILSSYGYKDKKKISKIISLNNNTYNVEQTFENDYYSEKILEKENLLYSFEQNLLEYTTFYECEKNCINIYQKSNDNKYIKISKIDNFTSIQNQQGSKFIDSCFINNNEIMIVLISGIKFLNLNNSQWSNEITDYQNNYHSDYSRRGNGQTSESFICKLNNNLYLIVGDNKFYIVDVIRHEINSIIKLEEGNKIIKSIKKDNKNNILVLMDNKYISMKDYYAVLDYFCIYKFENNRLEKIAENKERNKFIKSFEIMDDNKVAFSMSLYDSFFGYEKSNYINVMNY